MKTNNDGLLNLALTNKGNCFFAENSFEKAKRYYEDAIKIDASCIEALYNLGKLKLYFFSHFKILCSLIKMFYYRSYL